MVKTKRLLVQGQLDSKTIVDSFSRLLRRAKGTDTSYEGSFEICVGDLKRREPLKLQPIFHYNGLCWDKDIFSSFFRQASVVPSPKSVKTHDFILSCLLPAEIFDQEWRNRFTGNVSLTLPNDGGIISKRLKDTDTCVLSSFLHEKVRSFFLTRIFALCIHSAVFPCLQLQGFIYDLITSNLVG
eukprot:sb/3471484/